MVRRSQTRAFAAWSKAVMYGSVALGLLLAGCRELPDIRYETEHTKIGTFFEHEACEGSILQIEQWATQMASELEIPFEGSEKRTVYWGTEGLGEWCGDGIDGCYLGKPRVVVSRWKAISHELVHATRTRYEQTNTFVEEGLATALTTFTIDRSDTSRDPSELITLSKQRFEDVYGRNVASHFIRYLRDEYGVSTVIEMRERIGYSTTIMRVDEVLIDLLGASLTELQDEWRLEAPDIYVIDRLALPSASLDTDELVLEGKLDCSATTTFGPLTDEVYEVVAERAGMYRALYFDVAETSEVRLHLSSSNSTAHASLLRSGGCWESGSSEAPREIELDVGEEVMVELEACRWEITISVTDYSESEFSFRVARM